MPHVPNGQIRVFISYARESSHHIDSVRKLAKLLKSANITVIYDEPVSKRRDWPAWMTDQIEHSDAFIVVASPEYKRYGAGVAETRARGGVQWEAALIRDRLFANRPAWHPRIIPVILPGRSRTELPSWIQPDTSDLYVVDALTVQGIETIIEVVEGLNPYHDTKPPVSAPEIDSEPPAAVPVHFQDRQAILQKLQEALNRCPRGVMSLTAAAGTGRTGLIRRLFDDALENTTLPFDVLGYSSARSYDLITAASIVDFLIRAHGDEKERQVLREKLRPSDANWLERFDEVLASLGSRRVLYVLDDAEELMDSNGSLRDKSVQAMLEDLSSRDDHSLTILLVASKDPDPRLLNRNGESMLDMRPGLPEHYAAALLAGLCDVTPSPLGELLSDNPRNLYKLTKGHIRSLELLIAASLVDCELTEESLRSTAHTTEVDCVRSLLNIVLEKLTRVQRDVLEALAAIGYPASAQAIHRVLRQRVSESYIMETLDELTTTRVVRNVGGQFYVPPDPDASIILDSMGDGTPSADNPRLAQLILAAADYFAENKVDEPQDPHDLLPNFREIALRLKVGQRTKCLDLMADIDEPYLEKWGHSDALVPWRREIADALESFQHEVHNLSRLAEAVGGQGLHTQALDYLRHAYQVSKEFGLQQEAQLLEVQMANQYFRDGQVEAALACFKQSLASAERWSNELLGAQVKLGIHVCLMAVGSFNDAEAYLTGAFMWAEADSTESGRLLHTQLMLQRGNLYQCFGDDEAELWYKRARSLAHALDEPLLEARCLDALAVLEMDFGTASEAVEHASLAAVTGARAANADVSRQVNGSLALAFLRNEQFPQAYEAARSATRFARSPRSLGAVLVMGIAAYRLGRRWEAATAFWQALHHGRELLQHESRSYEVLESVGLAELGLFLLKERETDNRAVAAYRAAREVAPKARGIVSHALAIINDLSKEDPAWLTRSVRRAASGK